MSISGFGKAKYGGSGNYAKNFKLSVGKNGEATTVAYRILPPIKSLAEAGTWAVYVGTHYGYKGVNPRDASKPFHKTFKCIEERDFKTKTVFVRCDECDLIAQRKSEMEDAAAEAKRAGAKEDEIEELIKPTKDWLRDHNCDRKWQMNAMNVAGEFGVLHISHKTKKKLDAKIGTLQTDDGIDALDPEQGVWVKFTRTGKGVDTDDTVDVEYESVKDPVTARVSRTVKLAPLTDAQAAQALKDCPDLALNTAIITAAQIALLVQCSGEPEDVDAILASQKKEEVSPLPRPAAPPVKSAPAPAPTQRAATETLPAPVETEEDEEAALLAAQAAALAALKAKKAAAAAPQPVAPAPVETRQAVPATPAVTPAEGLPVDRAAFMARFGKPKS